MARQAIASKTEERNIVLGVRMTVDLRTKVRVEAAQRGLPIAELFEEMWRLYLERQNARRA
jgi:hypothetical protein